MPYWKLYYHVVWATKERIPLIQPEFEAELHNIIAAKALDLGATVYAVGGIENHIHLAVAILPKISIADFVGQLKGSSSHFVNYKLKIAFSWQAEYGILSFGNKDLPLVVDYVKNQRQHHSNKTSITSLETTG
jgi:putative transposase